jgi:ribonuclease D
MTTSLITDQSAFNELCDHIRQSGAVAFDTEFVSEFTYRPELCLLQFATRERCVAVDPFAVEDLTRWWEIMADNETTIVIHGGREEVRYCLNYTNQPPGCCWDVQVAEGLRSRSFPLGYEALVKRVLGRTAHGRETRTDWRRRPLTDQQTAYALDDVKHVLEIQEKQRRSLQSQKRLHWAEAEFQRMFDEVAAERGPDAWQRLPGLQRLSQRELAIVRAIYQWRDAEGAARNRPVRKILRDDLVVELARRRPQTEADLVACRDLNRPEYRKAAPQIIEAIARAADSPPSTWPTLPKSLDDDKSHDEQVVGQLLGLALANRCAELNVAMSLVGKVADLRHLVRWHVYGEQDGESPRLTQGWRAEVCGDLLTDVLDGRIALRVADPQSDHPLVFERRDEATGIDESD